MSEQLIADRETSPSTFNGEAWSQRMVQLLDQVNVALRIYSIQPELGGNH